MCFTLKLDLADRCFDGPRFKQQTINHCQVNLLIYLNHNFFDIVGTYSYGTNLALKVGLAPVETTHSDLTQYWWIGVRKSDLQRA